MWLRAGYEHIEYRLRIHMGDCGGVPHISIILKRDQPCMPVSNTSGTVGDTHTPPITQLGAWGVPTFPFNHRAFLSTLTNYPGVYRMIDSQGTIIYIGKAKDLRQRVGSYFRTELPPRLQHMVAQIANIEVTVTNSETEALLLENNLIKAFKPRYNVLLRDDKTYPHIYLTSHHPFPSLTLQRGVKAKVGRYFGPYPSASAARATLRLLQKLFPVRQCEDSWYRNRTRPCLQYQLQRCSGPCVGLITPESYAQDVFTTVLFLEGRTNEVTDMLVTRMDAAATQLKFEEAARLRDQIATLSRIQGRQHVSTETGDVDVVAAALQRGSACVQVFCIRDGNTLANQTFFLRIPAGEEDVANVMSAFLAQFYLGNKAPAEILVDQLPPDFVVIAEALTNQAGHKVIISSNLRGERASWVKLASQNAILALEAQLASASSYQERLQSLGGILGSVPQRLECFDISHTGGESPVAACVVFDHNGPKPADYRRFNLDGIADGDDYAALEQALTRRYLRVVKGEVPLPDVLCIDGGKGQLAQAEAVLAKLAITVPSLLGIAKGAKRKPGLEQLWVSGQAAPLILPSHAPALHLLQQLRDEAHRFAITGHRRRRAKTRRTSTLETIPGIGPKRRQLLLKQFGGMAGLKRAGIEDIAKLAGIGKILAQAIYASLHT